MPSRQRRLVAFALALFKYDFPKAPDPDDKLMLLAVFDSYMDEARIAVAAVQKHRKALPDGRP